MLCDEFEASGFLTTLLDKLNARFASISGHTVRGNPFVAGQIKRSHAFHLYVIVRSVGPSNLVETGVCNGLSSAVLLEAIRKNGFGHLYSIDYPEFSDERDYDQPFWEGKGGAVVPGDETCGWLVPPCLQTNWTLKLGRSQTVLPKLLADLQYIDLFLHDSEHSYDNQLFELRLAFEHLSKRGLVVASDINHSNAFDVFVEERSNQAEHFFVDHSLAVVSRLAERARPLGPAAKLTHPFQYRSPRLGRRSSLQHNADQNNHACFCTLAG